MRLNSSLTPGPHLLRILNSGPLRCYPGCWTRVGATARNNRMIRHCCLAAPLCAALMVLSSCGYSPAVGREARPEIPNEEARKVEVSLRPWSNTWEDDFPQLAFSKSGQVICLWLGPSLGPANFEVRDVEGNRVGGSRQTNSMDLLRDFPLVAWRWKCAEFVQEANFGGQQAFCFNASLSQGLRILVSKDRLGPVVAEMWRLADPRQRLWTQTLGLARDDTSLSYAKPIGKFSEWTNASAFVQITGTSCVELDSRTGAIRRTFTLGPVENHADAQARAKRLGWPEAGQRRNLIT